MKTWRYFLGHGCFWSPSPSLNAQLNLFRNSFYIELELKKKKKKKLDYLAKQTKKKKKNFFFLFCSTLLTHVMLIGQASS